MTSTSASVSRAPLTAAQVESLRAHASLVAEECAERCVRALEDRRRSSAVHWSGEYRRAAARCRALGDLLRSGDPEPAVRR